MIIPANFHNSSSFFVTLNDDIYIDNGASNGRVEKWIADTNTTVPVMNVFSSCSGLFVDINDNLYCSMYNHHQVVKKSLRDPVLTSDPIAGTSIQGSAPDELNGPAGIFVDGKFDLYVADCENDRIQLFQSGESNGTTVAGSKSPNRTITLDCPIGITFDAEKYLFIVDRNNHRIVGSGSDGFRCLVGCDGKNPQSTQLFFLSAFSFDISGNMFVVDQGNNQVRKFIYLEGSCGKSYKK
jgi:hypothetical protein